MRIWFLSSVAFIVYLIVYLKVLLFLPVILTCYCHGRRQEAPSDCQEVPGRGQEVLHPIRLV